MPKYTKPNPYVLRARLIDWAYSVPIPGNRQAVTAARRLLLYICGVVGLDRHKDNYLECWYSVHTLARELTMKPRRTYDALTRLRKAKLLTVLRQPKSNGRIVLLLSAETRMIFAKGIANFPREFAKPSANSSADLATEVIEENKEEKPASNELATYEYMTEVMANQAPWLLERKAAPLNPSQRKLSSAVDRVFNINGDS